MKSKVADLVKMLALSLALIGVIVLFNKKDNMCGEDNSVDNVYDFAMGTSVQVTIYGNEDKGFKANDVVDEIKRLDEEVISWREEGSELYKLNHEYVIGEPYRISDILYEALISSYDICDKSKGALDITIRPLALLWNIEEADDESFLVPAENEIKNALKNVGYNSIHIYASDKYVVLDKEDFLLDLGATGKGFALNIAYKSLTEHNVDGAMVSVGGSILVYGTKDSGKNNDAWRVGIRNPKGSQEDMIGYLEFPCAKDFQKYISTSGNYEKFVQKDGTIYHHILDSSTGYPASSGLAGVTVVCDNGLISDGLSTACYVLG
ncbi:MAG: FAD:protein FMN transferase, partial [Lachnospiraceae bacterium]|nr:FAD:protein FMN transferase [Lachnospiraceae bacterium]